MDRTRRRRHPEVAKPWNLERAPDISPGSGNHFSSSSRASKDARLVGRCEMAASSELAAWLSDAQQAALLVGEGGVGMVWAWGMYLMRMMVTVIVIVTVIVMVRVG